MHGILKTRAETHKYGMQPTCEVHTNNTRIGIKESGGTMSLLLSSLAIPVLTI